MKTNQTHKTTDVQVIYFKGGSYLGEEKLHESDLCFQGAMETLYLTLAEKFLKITLVC